MSNNRWRLANRTAALSFPRKRRHWLARLDTFTAGLNANFHSLRANVLYHRLRHDWRHGTVDPARLLAYLRLPRPVAYVNPRYRENKSVWEHVWEHEVQMDFGIPDLTGCDGIGNDEPLVRAILLRQLAGAANADAFAPYIASGWLKGVLAEAKLTSGAADAARWVSLLEPSAYQALKDRTDIEFDPACRELWKPDDDVTLDLWLKNVPHHLVKIYEINTENVHRTTGRQVNTDLNLDGLVANSEESHDSADAPILRKKHTFTFPALKGRRGVWIVELIGGGKSSRALLRKGSLRLLVHPTGAGTVVTVLDERLQPVPKAWAQIGPKRISADERGAILIPFSARPGAQNVILGDGTGFTSLEDITIAGENYALAAGFHVPRESLLPGTTATVAIRPVLLVNDRPAAPDALEKVTLTISSTTHEGTPATATYHDIKLRPDNETLIDFQVPERLSTLSFHLRAQVKSLVSGLPVNVEASHDFKVNGIATTKHASDLHLSRGGTEWLVHELGRNGEPRADREITVTVRRPEFRNGIDQMLKTDVSGAVHLGALAGVVTIRAASASGMEREWDLPHGGASLPEVIHAKAGEPVLITWPWPEAPSPQTVSLLEIRGETFVRNALNSASLKDGFLVLRGLTQGEYSLTIHRTGQEALLRVGGGTVVEGHALTAARTLELSNPAPVAITGMAETKDKSGLVFHIGHATPGTRIHVFASRFLPEWDAGDDLGADHMPEPAAGSPAWRPCLYQSARNIGDEYRYVLERRSAQKFPGNMLSRPGLLLNPWAIADTKSEKQQAERGEAAQEMAAEKAAKADAPAPETKPAESKKSDPAAAAPERMEPDLSFMASAGPVVFNLKPDAKGNIVIDRKALGDRQFLRVLAVQGDSSALRDFALPAPALRLRDLRLAGGLDPKAHFSQQNRVTLLEKDTAFQFKDALTAKFETIGSLGSVHQLFFNPTNDAALQEFSWLLEWPSLQEARKRELYSQYACHELHFFLARKDPDFFKAVILPSLASKRDRTFMDHYLLGADLTRYLRPGPYSRLNTLERILLAQRIVAERDPARRHIRDWLATAPRDQQREQFLFETALLGKALISDKSGIELAAANEPENSFPVTPTTPTAFPRTPGTLTDGEFDPPQIPQTFGGGGSLFPVDPFAPPDAGASTGKPSIVELEIIKRQKRNVEAVEVEVEGDELLVKHDYGGAIEKYQSALNVLPNNTANDRQRRRIITNYSRTAVIHARELAHHGNFDRAKVLLRSALAADMDANNKEAQRLLKELDDPDRYNEAMAKENAADPAEMSLHLRKAMGYYDLGQFNEAEAEINRVLTLDPYNTAARRLLEKTEREITNYFKGARDHKRLKILNDVDNLWVEAVPGAAKFPERGIFVPPATADFDVDATKGEAWRYEAERDRHGTFAAREVDYRKLALKRRGDAFYRQLPKTEVWAEQNYYRLPIADQTEDLVAMNHFWQDYVEWDGKGPFVSTHVAEAAGTLTEMLLALAVLDLPFPADTKPGKAERKENVLTFTPAGRAILFHQGIRSSESDKDGVPLLVSQGFYRQDDRYVEQGGVKSDKFVSGEFLTGTAYGCQVVLTNPSSSRQSLDVLFQIPAGSIPVMKTRPTQVTPLMLEPFHTQTLDYTFYFPAEGQFTHYPVHVARTGKTAAFAAAANFKVVSKPSQGDTASWEYVSQNSTSAEVLAFLEQHNLYLLDLDLMAWRLKDSDFFRKVMGHLCSRHVFHPLTWSYAVYHNEPRALTEYLEQRHDLIDECWKYLDCPLVSIDPVDRRTYEHLEYAPLINARAHRLGGSRSILNDKLRPQYQSLLGILICRKALTDEDRLAVTYYLALQDRIEEALEFFAKVDSAKIAEKLQYDYLQAWLAMCQEDVATARRITQEHADVPVIHWQEKFAALASPLDEIDGRKPANAKPEDREAGQDQLAANEPALMLTVENKTMNLTYHNLSMVTVNYYPMDLEFLFSSNPFVAQETSRFSAIRPNRSEEISLPAGKDTHAFALPAEYRSANVLVEISGGGQTKAVPVYANSLDVQVSENFGRLEVRHAISKKPVPKVYVKVFAQQNGTPVFYKDGYTDLRGKFDYASLSTGGLDGTQRFSVLVISQDFGAVVKELGVPAR